MNKKPLVLVVMDGVGLTDKDNGNAVKHAYTPNLDALRKQSLAFSNFFATGTRTDRGLEAITLSIPPTPGRSILITSAPNQASI